MAAISYKCPNCEGELLFDPSDGGYRCEYCGSSYTQEELEAMTAKGGEKEAVEPAEGDSEAVEYVCPSCGAQIVTDATTAATFCYYCHNPVTLTGRLEGSYLPDQVVPFAIDEQQARERFLAFVGRKWFVPKAFFDKKQIEKLSGVYFPFWSVEADGHGELDAKGARVRVWTDGQMEYTEKTFYDVRRAGELEIRNLGKLALQKANRELVEGVLPFDMKAAKDFHMGYLSGFLAEKRDLEKAGMETSVHRELQEYARGIMEDSADEYSSLHVRSCQFTSWQERWRYAMLPIWTITYRGRDRKTYFYSLNGQTGKVYGELPVDYKKLGLVSGLLALAVAAIGLMGGAFLW